MDIVQRQELLRRGCEQIVVLRLDRSLPSDRQFMTGIHEAAVRHGALGNCIDSIGLPPFLELISAELDLLFQLDRRLGIVCATREIAEAAWLAAKSAGRIPGEDFWLHARS